MTIIRKGWLSNILVTLLVTGDTVFEKRWKNSIGVNGFLVVNHSGIHVKTSSSSGHRGPLYSSSTESSTTDDVLVMKEGVLNDLEHCWSNDGSEWARDFIHGEIEEEQEACRMLYSIFSSLSSPSMMGVNGQPLYIPVSDLPSPVTKDYFSCTDLKLATQQEFLDAQRGSTDNRKGWQVYGVSNPRGSSFEDARMTWKDVLVAMEKGTVIFNSAGAHIPKLAALCLACCDATNLPNAVNLYLTKKQLRTSAPPHTDRQDVVVIQMTGSKRWRVYAPPNPSAKPQSDPFARGKMDDSLPLHKLPTETTLLLDVTLSPGDILFVPAAFPHTTDTIFDDTSTTEQDEQASLHLTFNFDSHVWDLDYLSLRQYALMRANVPDTALQMDSSKNKYTGTVNQLPKELWQDVMQHLPLTFLSPDTDEDTVVDQVTEKLQQLSKQIDPLTYDAVPSSIWKQTVQRVRQQGIELLDVHRDMYLAAMDEGRLRRTEGSINMPINNNNMQRLSIFRVDKYYKQVDVFKQNLMNWATELKTTTTTETSNDNDGGGSNSAAALPADWAMTYPLSNGDTVEADLGGAMFPATVTSSMNNNQYKVTFFDGDVEILPREMIRLVTPPTIQNDTDDDGEQPPPGLTKKELKRWRKKMEKKKRK